ncbi:MAG: glutamyl-tRNA reductase [Gammaproteobacteria bacterium]
MALLLVGINHTTAAIELREKVAFPPEIVADALTRISRLEQVSEVVIVSTCNRTELYLDCQLADKSAAADSDGQNGQLENQAVDPADLSEQYQRVVDWLADFHNLSVAELQDCSYFYCQDDVVRHLMKVSCGLDSMVLGEPQILGQIKSAYAVSKDMELIGSALGRAFQDAFSIAKEVRTDTAIGENPVSVAYAAVALAERIFSRLDKLHVLLIGAGRTVELVARHLMEKGVSNIVVANRTLDNALDMASRINAHGVLLSEIPEQLVHADIVVSSTNSQLPLLGKGTVERALKQRRHKPMLLVDLAVPRDIEAEVGEIGDAYLYTVDDISEVIEDGQKSRAEAASEAESIIERGIADYRKHMRSLNAVSTLKAFRSKADAIREQELQRALKALEKGEAADAVLASLARGLTNKLIHSPSVQMKKATAEGRDEVLQLTQELFELDDDQS